MTEQAHRFSVSVDASTWKDRVISVTLRDSRDTLAGGYTEIARFLNYNDAHKFGARFYRDNSAA